MRAFIAYAQQYDPTIPADLHNYIVAKYVEKRKLQREGIDEQSYMYVTPRTLLAIIRLAQANAKLNFRDEVKQYDVDEALKLMDFSIRSLRSMKTDKDTKRNSNILLITFRERIQQERPNDPGDISCERDNAASECSIDERN